MIFQCCSKGISKIILPSALPCRSPPWAKRPLPDWQGSASHDANIAYIDILQIDLGILAGQIAHGSYGIENLDAKYLAEDLIENEPELFE